MLRKILKYRDCPNENSNTHEINLQDGSSSGEGKCIPGYKQLDHSEVIGATTMKHFHEVIF